MRKKAKLCEGGCGTPIERRSRTCFPCFSKSGRMFRFTVGDPRTKLGGTRKDWAKDPCRLCGSYPLGERNTSGLCTKCRRKTNGRAVSRMRLTTA